MKLSEVKSIVEYVVNKEPYLQSRSLWIIHDIFEHLILRELYSTELFLDRVAFKGGTALSKCYLNYHRFSVDLDFTYIHDEEVNM
jgi:predicted nucleotidyltransferase component of viral defense system